MIPPEAKVPPETITIMNDPNIDRAIADLEAPRYPDEVSQEYWQRRAAGERQRRAAGERLRGTVEPAFIGHAGENTNNLTEQPAPSMNPISPKELERIPLADTLKDRIAYQRMRNEDLSQWRGSRIDNQGITFNANGKVIDEMRRLNHPLVITQRTERVPPGSTRAH
jgi:hypothetical protein